MEDTQTKIDSRYAALLMDCGFKAVFGDDRNKDVVISLLNRFLEGAHHTVDLEFMNNEQIGESLRISSLEASTTAARSTLSSTRRARRDTTRHRPEVHRELQDVKK